MALYGEQNVLSEDILAKLLQATGQQPQAAAPNAVPPMPPIAPPSPAQMPPLGTPRPSNMPLEPPVTSLPGQAQQPNKWMALAQALAPLAGSLIGGTRVGYGMLQGQQQASQLQREIEKEKEQRKFREQELAIKKQEAEMNASLRAAQVKKMDQEEEQRITATTERGVKFIGDIIQQNPSQPPERVENLARMWASSNKLPKDITENFVEMTKLMASGQINRPILWSPDRLDVMISPADEAKTKGLVDQGWQVVPPAVVPLLPRFQANQIALYKEKNPTNKLGSFDDFLNREVVIATKKAGQPLADEQIQEIAIKSKQVWDNRQGWEAAFTREHGGVPPTAAQLEEHDVRVFGRKMENAPGNIGLTYGPDNLPNGIGVKTINGLRQIPFTEEQKKNMQIASFGYPLRAPEAGAGKEISGIGFAMKQVSDIYPLLTKDLSQGPLAGRIKNALVGDLGGWGTTPQEQEYAQRVYNAVTTQAFAGGGQQLTITELGRFEKLLPSLKDTVSQAHVRFKLAMDFLADRLRFRLYAMPVSQRIQFGEILSIAGFSPQGYDTNPNWVPKEMSAPETKPENRRIHVIAPDGTMYTLPESQWPKAQKKGYKLPQVESSPL